jgi:hypothetical protein
MLIDVLAISYLHARTHKERVLFQSSVALFTLIIWKPNFSDSFFLFYFFATSLNFFPWAITHTIFLVVSFSPSLSHTHAFFLRDTHTNTHTPTHSLSFRHWITLFYAKLCLHYPGNGILLKFSAQVGHSGFTNTFNYKFYASKYKLLYVLPLLFIK